MYFYYYCVNYLRTIKMDIHSIPNNIKNLKNLEIL